MLLWMLWQCRDAAAVAGLCAVAGGALVRVAAMALERGWCPLAVGFGFLALGLSAGPDGAGRVRVFGALLIGAGLLCIYVGCGDGPCASPHATTEIFNSLATTEIFD